MISRLELYAYLIRLDRPIGIYLLLWPTLWALWIAAKGWPDPLVLFVFVSGVFLMRSAGCAINDFADRDIDPHVERTKNRPLAAGLVTSRETLLVFASLTALAFLLVLLMNTFTIYMSIAGVALAATYPFMKRFHYMPQVHLGAAFGWAVPMAFTAQTNELSPIAWLLFMATVLWATAYDTMYAMADREDDLKIGVKSTAILFGELDRAIIAMLQILLLMALALIGQQAELGLYYYFGLIVASGFALYQQYLIKDRHPQRCFQAFLNNNWFGMVIFIGVFIDYWVNG
ncbi:MAG TPA: 4-hydroxybenzoate octaprenyltransferase [Gammaproteobacteria bacterium]